MRCLRIGLIGEDRMRRKRSHIPAPLPQLHGAAVDVSGDPFDGSFVIVELKFADAGAKAAETYEVEPVIHRCIHPTGGRIARLSVAGAPNGPDRRWAGKGGASADESSLSAIVPHAPPLSGIGAIGDFRLDRFAERQPGDQPGAEASQRSA